MQISRRSLIGGVLAIAHAPGAALAQLTGGVATIGFVSERTLRSEYLDALRRGLGERGWVEGRSLRIESRSADGDLERLPGLIAELIGLKVNVIVTGLGTPVALAAKRATAKIPIVFVTGGDPVDFGIVPNAAKPGGNITGCGAGAAIIEQRVTLLREVSPQVKRVAFLTNLTNQIHPRIFAATQKAAARFDMTLREVGLFEATEFPDAFKRMREEKVQALFVPGDAMFTRNRNALVGLAAGDRLPAVYGDRQFPEVGGLMSLSADLVVLCRRAAGLVDKILRGAAPGTLAVEEADTFNLLVNVTTAKTLRLTIPDAVLRRAEIVR